MRLALLIALGASACSMGADPNGDDTTSDSPTGCSVSLAFDPMTAIAGPMTEIRVNAVVDGAPGVLTYTWAVTHGGGDVTFSYAQADQSAIAFVGADAGPYQVVLAIGGASGFCPTAMGVINVGVEGGNLAQVRLRVYPPASIAAPPTEKLVLVPGGAAFALGNVPIDPGVMATGHVRMGTAGVPAYLRFIPLGSRDAYVEGFTAADGRFDVRMQNQLHDVLVVPTVAGVAPRLVKNWMPGTLLLAVDGGALLTGTVRDPGGAPIANAQVQIELDGIPSTLATTNAAGSFTVRADLAGGVPEVRVEVTPPVATGLPRIAGASTSLSTATPFDVQYSAALVRRDLGGTVVRRGGAAQPNAPVKIVGTIGAVATINAGVPANGEVRIATQANGAGAIPAGVLAPAAPLFAVATVGGQLAVDAFDLTAAVPASIDAPAAVQIDTQLRDDAMTALPNAVIELSPVGALALAGAPAIRGVANATGNVTLIVPAGGRFDVRASDPLGRGAPLLLVDVPTASLSSAYALAKALHVTGSLVLSGNPQPVGRATVQILCTLCTGVERSRPLAEGASSSAGAFDVAVFDPGVN